MSLSRTTDLFLEAETFSKMNKLRLLKFSNVTFFDLLALSKKSLFWKSHGFRLKLSNEFRFLDWPGYPWKSIPSDFQPEKLVELNFSNSRIEWLWKRMRV